MSEKPTPSIEQQRVIAEFIASSVVRDATGEAEGDRCRGEPPSARYYLATLAPQDLNLAASVQRRGRETPRAAGFEFDAMRSGAPLQIQASVSCYYRVFPTLQEQLDYHGGGDPPGDRPGRTYRLAPVFQRMDVDVGEIAASVPVSATARVELGVDEFATAFEGVRGRVVDDPRAFRRAAGDRGDRMVPGAALASESTFETFVTGVVGQRVVPEWSAAISLAARAVAAGPQRVTVLLENRSTDPVVATRVRGQDAERHDDARDHFLFRIRLSVAADPGVVSPIRMNLGADAYRYDPTLPAYATNCGVAASYHSDRSVARLWTVPAPVFETQRTPAREYSECKFAELARDPLPGLVAVSERMRAYRDDPAWRVDGLEGPLAARKLADKRAFDLEIARFEEGIRWLRTDSRLHLAFRLANRAMLKSVEITGASHDGWRVFQLVFIISQLPALAWREHPASDFAPGLWGDPDGRDPTAAATVLWYPTAGGKTEAYLGLVTCAMFYDRARGKSRGVTAWCRFPLRLLTLQQTQRQLAVVVAADEVRIAAAAEFRAAGGDPGDRFAIGFYVGEGSTPNSLTRDGIMERLVGDAEFRRETRVVDDCPYCRARAVEVERPDPARVVLRHVCTSCRRELPLHVVDAEIYRYLPTVVVGTLDKLAMIGLSDKFGALLGDVDCECELHGFGRGMKCHERRASGHPKDKIRALASPLYDASPSLEVIDELHMVREELGAFSGHYEGALAEIQMQLSARARADRRPVHMKVVATTATIRGEDRQCEHLFGLRSVVVPLPGPSIEGSFYWQIDRSRPLRQFVGIMPHRATAEMALVRILQAFHRAMRLLESQGPATVPGLGAIGAAEFSALLDPYRVSLTYVTSLVDFGKLRRSMDTQVNEYLRGRDLRPVEVRELSSGTSHDKIREVTEDLLRPGGTTEAVVATSMISHGVDVERLNVMVFNGMPKSMAEYIQASSRVGRRFLGVVFMIFNPVRERDRSHFRYHGKFHEYLDRMVEPVAINRWSRYALQKTLPGVLMAEVLQLSNREWWNAGRAPTHLHELRRMQDALRPPDQGGLPSVQTPALIETLGRAYLSDRPDAEELRRELESGVRQAVESIRSAGAGAASAASRGQMQYRGTAEYLGLEYEPMFSLRDVAAGLPFFVLTDRRRA
jgi:hypothetical protein